MEQPPICACYPPSHTHISIFVGPYFLMLFTLRSLALKAWLTLSCRSMKSKIMATYPDAFPEDSTSEVIDRRPDLEMSK